MLEEPLRTASSQPCHYTSEKLAQADLKPWVEDVLKPLQTAGKFSDDGSTGD
jgi:hypothetical protein